MATKPPELSSAVKAVHAWAAHSHRLQALLQIKHDLATLEPLLADGAAQHVGSCPSRPSVDAGASQLVCQIGGKSGDLGNLKQQGQLDRASVLLCAASCPPRPGELKSLGGGACHVEGATPGT